jgi:outer membrane lipoprotein-sorting protein
MKMMRVLTMAGVACVALTAVSCKEKGRAEKAGEKIDKAVEKAADKVSEGAAKVEDKVKDALDSRPGEAARDALEDAKK